MTDKTVFGISTAINTAEENSYDILIIEGQYARSCITGSGTVRTLFAPTFAHRTSARER